MWEYKGKYKKAHLPTSLSNKRNVLKFLTKKRDNYTCQMCGLYDPEIVEVDHIKNKKQYPDLEFELSNLQTLCPNCHTRKSKRSGDHFPSHTKYKKNEGQNIVH